MDHVNQDNMVAWERYVYNLRARREGRKVLSSPPDTVKTYFISRDTLSSKVHTNKKDIENEHVAFLEGSLGISNGRKRLLFSCIDGSDAFAAKLTPEEVEDMKKRPEVATAVEMMYVPFAGTVKEEAIVVPTSDSMLCGKSL